MIFRDFKDFVAKLPPTWRLLGVDWGARRVGLAVSDESRGFVFPRGIIESSKQDVLNAIAKIIKSEQVAGVIIGLPLHADGTDSDTTRNVREFADALAAATDIPIGFMDERLTSIEATDITKNKKGLDSVAAAVILENAIAMIKRQNDEHKIYN